MPRGRTTASAPVVEADGTAGAETDGRPVPLLLDTHAVLWWFAASPRLTERARAAIADTRAPKHVSAASIWEIATKQRLDRLGGAAPPSRDLVGLFAGAGFALIPITPADAEAAGRLPDPSRDPFDRMLVAQAMLRGMALVSNETPFDAYDVARVW